MIDNNLKLEVLNGKIEGINTMIASLEAGLIEFPDNPSDKPLRQTVLDNLISERNTYSQILAELQ